MMMMMMMIKKVIMMMMMMISKSNNDEHTLAQCAQCNVAEAIVSSTMRARVVNQ